MTYRRLPLLVVVAAVLVAGVSSTADANVLPRRVRMLHLLNQTRRSHGLPVFRLNQSVSNFAWRHSNRMVARNYLFHTSNLYDAVRPYRPSTWGENVAMCLSLKRGEPSGCEAPRIGPTSSTVGIGGSGSAW